MSFLVSTASENLVMGLTIRQLLAIAIPIIAIQLSLVIAALTNLKGQDPAGLRGGKGLWIAILLISLIQYPLGLFGPLLYFTVGRKPYERD